MLLSPAQKKTKCHLKGLLNLIRLTIYKNTITHSPTNLLVFQRHSSLFSSVPDPAALLFQPLISDFPAASEPPPTLSGEAQEESETKEWRISFVRKWAWAIQHTNGKINIIMVNLDLSQKNEINAILERNVTLHRLITTTIFSTMKTKGSPTSVTFFWVATLFFLPRQCISPVTKLCLTFPEHFDHWLFLHNMKTTTYKQTKRCTSFSFFKLSSKVRTTALYCSTLVLAFFSCSDNSLFCSSAERRRPLTSPSSCSSWLDCWGVVGTGDRTVGFQRCDKPLQKQKKTYNITSKKQTLKPFDYLWVVL